MILAEMAAFDNLKELTEMAEDLATFVRQAAVATAPAHKVAKGAWQRILAMGRQATGHFLQMQGDGDVGETVETPDGKEVRRLPEPHRRTYHSIFGPFTLTRFVYGTREGQRIDFVPLDARLELPESEYSYLLQDWAGTLCVEHAFGRTAETLQAILGLSVPVGSLERMSRKYEVGDAHVDAETEVFTWTAREAAARRRAGQPMVCLMDGQRSLWTSCATHLAREDVAEVWDFLHATSYLWEAACLFHAEGSNEASAFVRDRTLRLLRGEVGYVIGGLRQMATKRGLSAAKQKKLARICNYFHGNRGRMRYDEYLAAG